MFKKIKDSEGLKKYRELRSNPQTKAIISLGFWFIFFVVIVLFVRTVGNKTVSKSDNINKINSYEFTYSNDIGVIFGRAYNKEKVFNVLNEKYYFNGDKLYKILGHNLEESSNSIGVIRIDLDMIDNLTGNIQSQNYSEYKRYLVPLSNFLNLYEGDTDVDLTSSSSYNIIIDKYYNSRLYMIKIDLSSYYNYRNINNDGILTIDIYNINKVYDLNEYSSMLRRG